MDAAANARELATHLVRDVPFNRWMGVELVAVHDDGVELAVPWREEFGGSVEKGHAHGGVLAAILDAAAGISIAVACGRGVPTVDLRLDFHRGVTPGPLRARGRILRQGRTLASVDAELCDASGRRVASARGVFFTG